MVAQYQYGQGYDTVVGPPRVEIAEEQYKTNYAISICEFIRSADPQSFQMYFNGDMNRCVEAAATAADIWFDKWKINTPKKIAARIAMAGRLRV